MALKILYILGSDSTHENIELRWSLRSLNKYCLCDVEPVIVGDAPDWFNGFVLTCDDKFNRKEKNIMRKIMKAIDAGLVADKFQISADDHFWLDTVDLSTLPIYYRHLVIEDNPNGNNYAKALMGTKEVLLKNGCMAYDTTVHCNQWVDANDVDKVRRLLEYAKGVEYANEYGLCSWAIWPNLFIGKLLPSGKIPEISLKWDIKFRKEPFMEFKRIVERQPICSINDCIFDNPDIVRYFNELYHGKSRWEK